MRAPPVVLRMRAGGAARAAALRRGHGDRADRAPSDELARETLGDAVRRLRPGGRLVLTTPDYGSAWPLVERVVDRLGDVEYYVQHVNKFRPAA